MGYVPREELGDDAGGVEALFTNLEVEAVWADTADGEIAGGAGVTAKEVHRAARGDVANGILSGNHTESGERGALRKNPDVKPAVL